ncbi:MAG: sigma-54-dependent Fis family transcriptional regulator [Desulfobacterales bacterium]|nr:sigma-54-dependent Fis family transcriptional regulator [Desulfobacterales bacterium]
MFPSILIVDDEPSIVQSLAGLLIDEGFEVITASNGYEALKVIDTESPDLVLLDVWMPGIDGIDTLKEIKKSSPFIQVIIITGHGTIETAVKATKLGAYDFIEKPLSIDKVIVAINNALNFRRLEEENRYLRKKTIEKHSITGNSPTTMELKKQVAIAAPKDSWIMITGENGTGKELVARTIHQLSARSDQPLVDVNCAAIPEDLIESELFGHEKGAFTGATTKKRGKFEMANKGTLFLDEIADMSLKTQGKILRALQEQQFQRLGGSRTISVDVRVIAASNKDLSREIESGRFREDLYYRLNVIPISVTPLRNRTEDIPLLVETFLEESARSDSNSPKTITDKALAKIQGYAWPGNVRELKNLVERLAIMVEGDVIDVGDIPDLGTDGEAAGQPLEHRLFTMDRLKDAKKFFEGEFIRRKLEEQGHNITKTAESMGVARSYLHKKLKEK